MSERFPNPFDPLAMGLFPGRLQRHPSHRPEWGGRYMVTTVTFDRRRSLARLVAGRSELTPLGQVVEEVWFGLARDRREVVLERGEFVVMPDHVHGLVRIDPGRLGLGEQVRGLSALMGVFKSESARTINEILGTAGQPFWKPGFHDWVIRDERALRAMRAYVANNPRKAWLKLQRKRSR